MDTDENCVLTCVGQAEGQSARNASMPFSDLLVLSLALLPESLCRPNLMESRRRLTQEGTPSRVGGQPAVPEIVKGADGHDVDGQVAPLARSCTCRPLSSILGRPVCVALSTAAFKLGWGLALGERAGHYVHVMFACGASPDSKWRCRGLGDEVCQGARSGVPFACILTNTREQEFSCDGYHPGLPALDDLDTCRRPLENTGADLGRREASSQATKVAVCHQASTAPGHVVLALAVR